MDIAAWGDSITYGSCDSEALGWVGRLRKSLPTDDYYQLYNFGICGDTTADLLRRFPVELEASKPEKILLAIGINDSKLPGDSAANNVPLDHFTSNLERIIEYAKTVSTDITFIGLTKVAEEWRSARGSRFLNEEIERYNTTIQTIATEHNLPFIDMLQEIDPKTDLADGLHPNAKGYEKMYEVIRQEIKLPSL